MIKGTITRGAGRVFLWSVLLLFLCEGCKANHDSEWEKMREKWGNEKYAAVFEADGQEYSLDMGETAVQLAELVETENWICPEQYYGAFQGFSSDIYFYFDSEQNLEEGVEITAVFREPFIYQETQYVMALYPDLKLEKNMRHILSPDLELTAEATAAATTEWDRDYDFDKDIKEEMERGYTLIGILPGFQFPDKFYEPVFSKEEKQAAKELELFQNTEDFWCEKLNGAQETMYLQYWNGFSSYYRMVYQDEDNKRYYSVILDEAGNIKREKRMIGQDEYRNISKIGIHVS